MNPLWRKKKPASIPDRIPDRVPAHVAIIMDGNGRWAQARGLPRIEGHRQGALAVRRTLEACKELGVSLLTLFCFSTENWKRPKEELDFLMGLLRQYLINERPTLEQNGIRLRIIGRREGLPDDILKEMDRSISLSAANTAMTLCLAINYGSRTELVDAIQRIADQVQQGSLLPSNIDEETVQRHLYTADFPDPDLLIRTSGEMRVSNFLLWQISYSEIWITEKAWPDFERADLITAIESYARRDRRFGAIAT